MKSYQERKEEIRQQAIDWQQKFIENYTCDWLEISLTAARFEKLAKRYGLVREFKENAII